MWNRGQQEQGSVDIRGSQFRHQVKLHHREAFPPEVYDGYPHCLRHIENARSQGRDHYKADQRDALAYENATLTHAR
jgi:hypothetical protein